VLYLEATVDAALGEARKLEGLVYNGGGGRVGDFMALPIALQ
jgi:hypothetical protein